MKEAVLSSSLRVQLQQLGTNPFLSDRVDSPFEDRVSDTKQLNQRAFEALRDEIRALRAWPDKRSRGVLVMGKAGSGKTHLLSRLHQELGEENHMLFVPRPSNPDGILSFTWQRILESLDRPKSKLTSTTQGEMLLREAFASMLRRSIAEEPMDDKLRHDWGCLLARVTAGETLGDNLEKVRNRILYYYGQHHVNLPIHQNILHGLFNYVFYRDIQRRPQVLQCLGEYEVDEKVAAAVGLKPWRTAADEGDHRELVTRREEWALDVIRVVSILAGYGRPLVLAFDQLEGMRGRPELTMAWGHAVQYIMTQSSNVIVLCCVFPDLWKEWFTKPDSHGTALLEEAVVHRIAARKISLETPTYEVAKTLVNNRFSSFLRSHHIEGEDELFDDETLRIIWSELDSNCPRRLFQRCKESYDGLILSHGTPTISLRSVITEKIKTTPTPPLKQREDDGDWVAKLREVIERVGLITKVEWLPEFKLKNNRVLPSHLVFKLNGTLQTGTIAVAYSNQGLKSLSPRLKNWRTLIDENPSCDFIFLRSEDSAQPSWESAVHGQLKDLGSSFRVLSLAHEQYIAGCHAAMVAVEEQELWCGSSKVGVEDLAIFLEAEGLQAILGLLGIPFVFDTEGDTRRVILDRSIPQEQTRSSSDDSEMEQRHQSGHTREDTAGVIIYKNRRGQEERLPIRDEDEALFLGVFNEIHRHRTEHSPIMLALRALERLSDAPSVEIDLEGLVKAIIAVRDGSARYVSTEEGAVQSAIVQFLLNSEVTSSDYSLIKSSLPTIGAIVLYEEDEGDERPKWKLLSKSDASAYREALNASNGLEWRKGKELRSSIREIHDRFLSSTEIDPFVLERAIIYSRKAHGVLFAEEWQQVDLCSPDKQSRAETLIAILPGAELKGLKPRRMAWRDGECLTVANWREVYVRIIEMAVARGDDRDFRKCALFQWLKGNPSKLHAPVQVGGRYWIETNLATSVISRRLELINRTILAPAGRGDFVVEAYQRTPEV